MSQDDTDRHKTDLTDLGAMAQTLTGLQRRLSKAPTPQNALLRDAVREALLVVSRAQLLRSSEPGTAAIRR